MRITREYRKFRKELLAKGYRESDIYNYYQETGADEPSEDPLTHEELISDFTKGYMPLIYSERLDRLSLEEIIAPRNLKGTKVA